MVPMPRINGLQLNNDFQALGSSMANPEEGKISLPVDTNELIGDDG